MAICNELRELIQVDGVLTRFLEGFTRSDRRRVPYFPDEDLGSLWRHFHGLGVTRPSACANLIALP